MNICRGYSRKLASEGFLSHVQTWHLLRGVRDIIKDSDISDVLSYLLSYGCPALLLLSAISLADGSTLSLLTL